MRKVTGIALLTLLCFCQRKSEEPSAGIEQIKTDLPDKVTVEAEHHCYLKVSGKDSIKLYFEQRGDSVSGIYHNLPYGIDKRISTFKGTVRSNRAATISRYSAEGKEYIEELHFIIKNDQALLNYGLVEQDKAGVWRYKANEPLAEHVLPKIDCALATELTK